MEHCRKFINDLMMVMTTLNFCNRIPHPIFGLLGQRLGLIRQKIERLTDRIEAGTFVPRKKNRPPREASQPTALAAQKAPDPPGVARRAADGQ
jgi:hypothetical protein